MELNGADECSLRYHHGRIRGGRAVGYGFIRLSRQTRRDQMQARPDAVRGIVFLFGTP